MAENESEVRNGPEIQTGKAAAPTIQAGRGMPDTGERPEGAAVGSPGCNSSAVPTAMLIRIFGKKDHEPYGDIVHYDLKKPVPYQGAAELVLRIDAISRSLDPSDSGSTFRSVGKARDESANVLPEEYWKKAAEKTFMVQESMDQKSIDQGKPESMDKGLVYREPGEKGTPPPRVRDTIYLQLIGRQHTSIQGRIWGRVTRKRYVSFRSALELIYLLSEAV